MLKQGTVLAVTALLATATAEAQTTDASTAGGFGGTAATAPAPSAALSIFDTDNGARLNTRLGDPLPGLTADQLALFNSGKATFQEEENATEDGLGPVFNNTSCASCHNVPATGGGSTTLETRFGKMSGGKFDPLANEGGSLIQTTGIGVFPDPNGGPACNYVGELVPADANVQAGRRTTPLFGFGLVDAVPELELRLLASHERLAFPGEAGTVAVVHDIKNNRNAVGRFGWKNQNPNVHQFSGDAYLNEMGITNPEFPNENCPQGDCSLLRCNPVPTLNDDGGDVTEFTNFITLLAPPPRGPTTGSVVHGGQVFRTVGCNHCHTPTLVTGPSPIAAISGKLFHPYSDFLLHDMGSLGDGIEQPPAGVRLMRTAPLWGVNQITSLLHDGRASSVSDAIQAHDGQGAQAKRNFNRLSPADKQALLDFVNSL